MCNRDLSIWCFWGGALTTLILVFSRPCTANCPTRSDVVPLDLNQLSGEWFLVAGTPATGKSLSKCGRLAVSSSSPDTLVMNYTAVTRGFNKPVALLLNARLEDDIVANMQLQGSKRTRGPYTLRVITADYDSHFVLVICAANDALKDFSMILSRNSALPSSILATLKNKLGSYFDRDVIVDVDHSIC